MKHKEIADKVAVLLSKDAGLGTNWVQPPEVTHIPFMGNREHFFLLVSLYVKPELADRVVLLSECLSAACFVIKSGLLVDEKAVEIAAYVDRQKKLRRVSRLTVLDTAFDLALNVKAADVLNQSIAGITSQWPLQHPQ